MYHDYFDDTSGLRNPYGPEVPPAGERTSHRQRLLLLGLVGAGLTVVAPVAGGALPGSGRVATGPESAGTHRTAVPLQAGHPADRP